MNRGSDPVLTKSRATDDSNLRLMTSALLDVVRAGRDDLKRDAKENNVSNMDVIERTGLSAVGAD